MVVFIYLIVIAIMSMMMNDMPRAWMWAAISSDEKR